MVQREWLARNLAATLLGGKWTSQELERRAAEFFGDIHPKIRRRLVHGLMADAAKAYPPSPDALVAHFLSSGRFIRLSMALRRSGRLPAVALESAQFAPISALAGLKIPELSTPADLAKWLDLSLEQLDWLADTRRQHIRTAIPILQHYFYTFIPKRRGLPRLIEAPKPRLRAIQRRILHEMLDVLPAHEKAHGFVRGRSCLSGAQIHAGEFIVVAVDLRSFFTSVPIARVHALFRSLGYPWAVARLLTGLCTTSTPVSVFQRPEGRRFDWETRKRYGVPHLPQGAPTSPALANLSAWRLDQRLTGLARSFGANYSRYADDLAFSGDEIFAARVKSFQHLVATIARDEGFALNGGKTRIMRRGTCQRLTGLIVNEHLNVPRKSYDDLKAILHNCVRFGPHGQNRHALPDFRGHLEGRVGWVESVNSKRGAKLRRIFAAIPW